MAGHSGKCPVDHKLLAEQQQAQSTAREENGSKAQETMGQPESTGRCPVDHKSLADSRTEPGKCPVDHSQITKGEAEQAGKCPVDHSALSAIPGGLKENGKPPKAVCPFGFGSSESGGPTMTSLHCPKCKALFFDCVQSSCGHNFCRDCIVPSKECLRCGDEVTDVKPEGKVQELVDTYVATHSTDAKFLEDRAAAGNTEDPERIQAEFLLEVALQSFAGGNYKAALARLQLCKTHLLRVAEGEGEEKGKQPGADIAVQLGAVCGSQGDCQARLGDADEATASYEASITYLLDCPAKSSEVEQALTVTQNKLGDLLYRQGDLRGALDLYNKALEARQAIAAARVGDEKASAELDVGFSLAKAADLEQVTGNSTRGMDLLRQARDLAQKLEQQKEKLDPPGKKRLESLNAFLAK